MRPAKRFGFLLVFTVPTTLPVAVMLREATTLGDAALWFPLLYLFVLLPLADYALGRDRGNPADDRASAQLDGQRLFRWLTLACVPVQWAFLAGSARWFAGAGLDAVATAGWLLSQGVVSGVLAINVAHELIHRRGRLEPLAGGLLLLSTGYHGFKIEHLRGHHVHVATPEDASSAPRGASVYGFVAGALLRNTRAAWRLESERLARLGLGALHWRNEMLAWTLAWLALVAAFALALGPLGALFFVGQGLVAACSLEIINYVEHYGLARRRLANGRYERPDRHHSWNSNYLLTNLMLFQLQRHSDHHENPRRRYQSLRHFDESPQLPGGYAAMFVLALVPPLWRRVIHPRLDALAEREGVAAS